MKASYTAQLVTSKLALSRHFSNINDLDNQF